MSQVWKYDPSVDALAIAFKQGARSHETRELASGIVADFDKHGDLVTLEILDARRRLGDGFLEPLQRSAPRMNLRDAAALIGVDPATLRQQISRGNLRAKKSGRDWTVARNDVEHYARTRGRRARPGSSRVSKA